MGVYIVHPKCENTRMPKILAYKRDKVVIHQNGVVWDQIYNNHKAAIFAMQENFTSIAKISLLRCIKACITTPKFSICVNGELTGFFASNRGVRQEDPFPPFCFLLLWKPSRDLYLWRFSIQDLISTRNVRDQYLTLVLC